MASGGNEIYIRIWSITTGQTLMSINVGTGVVSLKLLTNGIHLASGLYSGQINVYDVTTGMLNATLSGHSSWVNDLVLMGSNSDLLASSSQDNLIIIWNLTNNLQQFILRGHQSYVRGLKIISMDTLSSCSDDSAIKVWNITNGTLIRTLTGHTGQIFNSLDLLDGDYDKIGQQLVSGSLDQNIKSWNWTTGECLNTVNTGSLIRSLTMVNFTSEHLIHFEKYRS
jgi:WD40 repeat protein